MIEGSVFLYWLVVVFLIIWCIVGLKNLLK